MHLFFFFFQAEDGIRDFHVTGVQTCALPICSFGLCLLLLERLQRAGEVFHRRLFGRSCRLSGWLHVRRVLLLGGLGFGLLIGSDFLGLGGRSVVGFFERHGLRTRT